MRISDINHVDQSELFVTDAGHLAQALRREPDPLLSRIGTCERV
jgi:hypothetical protein